MPLTRISPELRATLMADLIAAHQPDLITRPEGGDGKHVAQIWEDGEFTLQKGGSLFGARHLHCIRGAHPDLIDAPMDLPLPMYKHKCVVVPFEFAQEWVTKLWGF